MTRPCPASESVLSSGRAEWLGQRRSGIGGSDVAAILGMSKYASPRDVWLSKVGEVPDLAPSWPMRRGNALELPLLEWFSERTGHGFARLPMQRNVERPWMLGSLDGAVTDESPAGAIECKTASYWVGRADWSDGPADHAELQLQWYLAVTGLSHGWIVAALGDADPQIIPVERNEPLIGVMISQAERFWTDYVLAGVEPELQWQDRDAVAGEFPRVERAVARVDAESDIDVLARQRVEVRAQISQLERVMQAADAKLIAALGDAEQLVAGGEVIATRKEVAARSFDRDAAEAAGVDLSPYMTTTTTRRLTVLPVRKTYKEN